MAEALCRACKESSEIVAWMTCRECWVKHGKGELPLGQCMRCEELIDLEEMANASPPPGA